jgi:hypothetical protein
MVVGVVTTDDDLFVRMLQQFDHNVQWYDNALVANRSNYLAPVSLRILAQLPFTF